MVLIRERIQARMKALGLKIVDVHERMGLGKSTYVNNFLSGKQKTFDPERVPALAVALECSVAYLAGESDDVGSPPSGVILDRTAEPSSPHPAAPLSSKLTGRGFVEAGAFRKPGITQAINTENVTPLPNVPLAEQSVYKVQDDSLLDIWVTRESLLLCVDADDMAAVESGTIVIVEHSRRGGAEVEISARELQHFPNRTELRVVTPTDGAETLILRDGKIDRPDSEARIVARVVQALRWPRAQARA